MPLTPAEVSRLVKEETIDVEQFEGVAPPELVSGGPNNYSLRKRLQRYRIRDEQSITALQEVSLWAPSLHAFEIFTLVHSKTTV